MANLGQPKTFLGLNIIRDIKKQSISINQTEYIHRMLERFDITNCQPAPTPLDPTLSMIKTMQNDHLAD